ncbi:hypothetical protein HKD37_18G050733 [Glycine soja]
MCVSLQGSKGSLNCKHHEPHDEGSSIKSMLYKLLVEKGWEWKFKWRRHLFDRELEMADCFRNDVAGSCIQIHKKDDWIWKIDPTGQYSNTSIMMGIYDMGQHSWSFSAETVAALFPARVLRIRLNRWRSWWLALTWTVWQHRNKIIFSNQTFDGNKLMEDAIFTLWTWLKNFDKDFAFTYSYWSSNIASGFGLLMQQNGELWTRVLNSKYGGWRNLEETGNSAKQCVWWRDESMSWMNIKGAFPFSPKQHFMQHISIHIEGLRAKRWRYWWLAVTWSIWKLKNRILFANAEFDTNRLFEDAIFIIWTWLRQFEKDFTVHYNQWSNWHLIRRTYGSASLLHPSSNSVSRVFFDPGQCGFCGVRATTIWVFRQRRGFCGFQRRQCGFSGSVGGSVGSTNDNVGVDGAVSDRFRAEGEREQQFQAGG